ncbi:hypothetical protein HOD96_00525 [Candidatus Falkowbacteria bacterium]|jgi:hypothetical protein|nr:hypothetical protein [Candidatus Falkowbacteria bacterium]MBT4433277.1 hypothetical protein [Candidatus Falkowbacteria bacterium]
MEKDLLQQLKSLNRIQPSTAWKSSAREDILAQVMSEDTPQKLGKGAEFFYFLKFSNGFFQDFIMRPVGTFALILILILGGGALKVKADGSLPGDLLYFLKRGGEKAQMAFIFDEDKKSDLQLELVDKRIRELNRIALAENNDNQEKMRKALENFHKDFTLVKENMHLAQNDPEKALKMAQKMEDKTSEMHFVLNKVQDKSSDNAKNDIKEAMDEVSEANFSALEVIVEKDENKEIQGIAQKIDEKIEEASEEAEEAGGEALAKLEEAKKELVNMQFVAALQKVKESKEIIDQASSNEDIEGKEETSTSTIDIITEESQNTTTTDLFLNNDNSPTSTIFSTGMVKGTSTEDTGTSSSTEE